MDQQDRPLSPDQAAAHELLSELRTRISTQPLPYQYGIESRALESLWEVFGQARLAMKNHPGCDKFARRTTKMLNVDLRPVTAKWHRAYSEGRLNSRDGANEFRADLDAVQEKLRSFAADLHKMAYDTPFEDELTPNPLTEEELAKCFADLPFGIRPSGLINSDIIDRINADEGQAVDKRRKIYSLLQDRNNAVGLGLSGGGIRSATFCLGVCQVLAQRGLLKEVDFLSTVSGGGYLGSFLTTYLTSKNAYTNVSAPHGPDPAPVSQLRRRAKYLSANNLKQRWSMVTATFAGLVLNWSAPLLLVTLAALAAALIQRCEMPWEALLVTSGAVTVSALLHYAYKMLSLGKAGGWFLGASSAATLFVAFLWLLSAKPWEELLVMTGAVTVFALLHYAYQMRSLEKAGGWFLGASSAVTLFVAFLWLLSWLYDLTHDVDLLSNWKVGGLIAGAVAALPMFVRFLPILRTPAARRVVLKAMLSLAGLVIPIGAILLSFGLYDLGKSPMDPLAPAWHPLHYTDGLVVLAGLAVAFGAVAIFLLNINLTAPHRLYRDQLARTFIHGVADGAPPPELQHINEDGYAPYHLINATLNLPSSESEALRERKSDFFLFSKHWCGALSIGYRETMKWHAGKKPIDLATAMAVSGAAASSYMGLGSIRSLTALMTFLNLRLGYWIRRPEVQGLPWIARQLGRSKTPGFVCLIQEMFGIAMSENQAWVNLSDGGHIENMGVYELLRRRCKFIISVDGEADPDSMFHGHLTLVRHAQIDFGVRIEPTLTDLRQDLTTKFSQSHSMLCRIHYPEKKGEPDSIGLLLYLKLSVTGDELELIKRYRALNPDFPHQSTLDQFFEEEQFEAYRQIGVHVAEGLFSPALLNGNTRPASVQEWFRSLARNLLLPEKG
ncbi:hypothetical protein [Azospirillum largimobile]